MTRRPFLQALKRAGPVALPVLAGLATFWRFGAPAHYAAINAGAFFLGLAAMLFVREPTAKAAQQIIMLTLLAILALPLVTGPEVESVRRWLALGPVQLNTGLLVIPLLGTLAIRNARWGWLYLVAAIGLAALQPDAAAIMALCGALLVFVVIHRDWRAAAGLLAGAGLAAFASTKGALPPVAFVEEIVPHTWDGLGAPIHSIAVVLALAAAIGLLGARRNAESYVVSAILAGFCLACFLGPYPYPMVGYGAASILGFMLALAMIAPASTAIAERQQA